MASEPLSTGQLIDRAGPAGSVRSAVQRLADDERLVRTGRNEWALASWGAEPYRPLDAGLASASAELARSRPRQRSLRIPCVPSPDLLRPPPAA
ncbi:MAG: hypothetical protein WCA46_29865 [Actinocatenispora sp.]